jgi:large subunit ribosomal protein L22
MQAHHYSARLAPKKANLVAQMVRGMPVPDAMEMLRKTHKKGARLLEDVLRSAIANAQHNFKQDAQMMVIKTIVVNQGTHYRRGTPMARGRVRPIKKFLCHISLTLGFPGDLHQPTKREKKASKASAAPKAPVKAAKAPVGPSTAKSPSSTSTSK